MNNVIELYRRRTFSIEEVNQILPVIWKITNQISGDVKNLITRLEVAQDKNTELAERLEKEINTIVESWQSKMEKLGGKTKGLWIVDFDSGDGYYCWKFPEEKVEHWHAYSDGFSGRVKVQSKLQTSQEKLAQKETPAHLD